MMETLRQSQRDPSARLVTNRNNGDDVQSQDSKASVNTTGDRQRVSLLDYSYFGSFYHFDYQ